MSFQIRISGQARTDLIRLHRFQATRDPAVGRRALTAIHQAFASLASAPFIYRKAQPNNAFLREIIIPFGSAGYVALYEIDNDKSVTVLAVRHQLEEDYY